MSDIRYLQGEILYIAKYFHSFCQEHNLTYYLLGGTALGAARHSGFIPWDDDFDVCMPQSDYEKLIELSAQISDEFYFQKENTHEWPLYFSKLRLANSFYLEKEDVGRLMHNGIYIDIMCLSESYNNKILHYLQYFAAKILSAEALFQRGYTTNALSKKYFIHTAKIITTLLNKKTILNFVRPQIAPLIKGKFYNHFFGRAKFKYAIIKKEYCEKSMDVIFESEKFKCMGEYRSYLRDRFGDDYMEPPSADIRNSYPAHCVSFLTRSDVEKQK